MRLTIRYVSRFRYPDSAWDSHNVLRACPTTDASQRLLDYQLEVEPAARVTSYVDSWGTRIDEFGVRDRHWELLVAARSTVETSERPAPGWESVVAGRGRVRRAGVPGQQLGLSPGHAAHPDAPA